MKKQIISWVVVAILAVGGFWLYQYGNKIEMPKVTENGEISGNYSIESIMALGQPYVCNFDKSDSTSRIVGVIHTDGKNIYGEFRIKTDLVKNEFNSFLLVRDKQAYTWTSLAPMGYKSVVAKSANTNASPVEQSQIVGTRDKIEYQCKLWNKVESTFFEVPSFITFSELKK